MFQKPISPPILQSSATPAALRSDDVETVVGPSVNVEGDFSSEGNIIVKGTVSGSVKTSKLLTVEPGAKIFANLKAGSALIAGEIRGNVKVGEKLELTSTARVGGDVECQTLVVEAGALLCGKVSMKGLEGLLEKREDKRSALGFRGKLKLAEGGGEEAAV